MKPKSKAEHAMLALAAKLPPITEKQRQYAFTHAFAPRAVIKPRKREVRCLCCGQTVVYDKPYIDSFLRNGQYDCPYCGRTMGAEKNSPDTPWREWRYFTVITTFRGHQVARTWEVARLNYTHGHYYAQGEPLGKFGFSVQKKAARKAGAKNNQDNNQSR